MSTLRNLVVAWRAQEKRCQQAFDAALEGVNRELDAVGGYATTSPDKDGYCHDYTRQADTFGGGVTKVGKDAGRPHEGKMTPYLPEVGDRCFALDQEWRKEAMALTETMLAIQAHVGRGDRCNQYTDLIVNMAAKLVDDEARERELVIKWLRFAGTVHMETEATNLQQHAISEVAREALLGAAREIERGEHLR